METFFAVGCPAVVGILVGYFIGCREQNKCNEEWLINTGRGEYFIDEDNQKRFRLIAHKGK